VKTEAPAKGRFEPAAKHDTDTIPRRPDNPWPRLTAFQYWLRFDWRHHGVLFGAVCWGSRAVRRSGGMLTADSPLDRSVASFRWTKAAPAPRGTPRGDGPQLGQRREGGGDHCCRLLRCLVREEEHFARDRHQDHVVS